MHKRTTKLAAGAVLWPQLVVVKKLCLGKASTCMHGGPDLGVVRSDGPSACTAHAEPEENDAVNIDLVLLLHLLNRVQHVERARILVANSLTAEGVQNNPPVAGLELAPGIRVLRVADANEVNVSLRGTATVQPDVER